MTKDQAKQFSEIMTDWLLKAVTIQFKNEDDEYQQMADYFNSRIDKIDEDKLEELAINECFEILKGETFWYEDVECVVVSAAEECYKAGYRKAMED